MTVIEMRLIEMTVTEMRQCFKNFIVSNLTEALLRLRTLALL